MRIQTFFHIVLIYMITITGRTETQEKIVDIKSKVIKIDSTKSFYIIDIGLKNNKGVLIIPKACDNHLLKKRKIKKNAEYLFKLKQRHDPDNSFLPKKDVVVEYADEKLVWSNRMKKTFYEECLNMCGLFIEN